MVDVRGEKMITRGTTPTLEFTIPFDTALLSEAWVTLSQNDVIIIDKQLKDCSCDAKKLTVDLTQDETLLLDCSCRTEIQLRVKLNDGKALASAVIVVDTERIIKDGVI